MEHALLLDGVTKRFDGHLAVDHLDLVVPRGTIFGILGPNGAGKSTTLRMVMNILLRDAGRIDLLGKDPQADRDVLRRVGFLPEERGIYRKMKVLEVIVFFARLKGMDARAAKREGEAWLERMGLAEWRDAKVEMLSKGMQQKVQFITTVLHTPDLLILDEPQSGLDPVNQEVLRDTILDWAAQGRTVLFSTHNMDQAEQLCESVCIIARGRKVLDGRLRDVRRAHAGHRYRVELEGAPAEAERFFAAQRFGAAERAGEGWRIDLGPGGDVRALVASLNELSAPLRRFEHETPSLHEIFVRKVGETAATAARTVEAAHV